MKDIRKDIDQILSEHDIHLQFQADEVKNIPANKPTVIVSRRLKGPLDRLLMLRVMQEQNLNSRIIVFEKDEVVDMFPDYFIYVDLEGDVAFRELLKMKSQLSNHLEAGGSVGLFPARARFYSKGLKYDIDKKWEPSMIRLVNNIQMPVVPISLNVLNKPKKGEPEVINIRVGSPIPLAEQEAFTSISRLTRFLRARTLSLGTPIDVKQFYFPSQPKLDAKHQIALPVSDEMIHKEIDNLRSLGRSLFKQSEFEILVARANMIPNTLLEIGRLREITFRDVDEGSNKPRDLDEYDLYYSHLIIYDAEAGRLVGGYRIGRGDMIYAAYGIKGFYIASLFKFDKKFGEYLKESAELGRAYIIPDYQRKRLPLFLLWRGILSFLLDNPQYKYLIGPLSISQQYSDISKQVIIEFIKKHYYNKKLAKLVKPRKPFEVKVKDLDTKVILESFQGDINKLDNFIEDVEPFHFRVPVLMKKYIKQNARIISFNVDPKFSDTLDGLMMLDLKELPQETIEALKKEDQ